MSTSGLSTTRVRKFKDLPNNAGLSTAYLGFTSTAEYHQFLDVQVGSRWPSRTAVAPCRSPPSPASGQLQFPKPAATPK
ncbi:unnamed protein product [Clonostachys rosea f. rosea IK726]|uniref:Uncharacterized protein n=1 Tax=Clonostachys rosea f. rosea IK726 TaxID=1349383 RepID=A0ACA9UHH9_BIOOC|nr:unnamed protein product [Clonostachys rosea f. rosea IK726]